VIEKIVTARWKSSTRRIGLYEQHYIRDESVTIKEMITQAIANLGENIGRAAFCALQGW